MWFFSLNWQLSIYYKWLFVYIYWCIQQRILNSVKNNSPSVPDHGTRRHFGYAHACTIKISFMLILYEWLFLSLCGHSITVGRQFLWCNRAYPLCLDECVIFYDCLLHISQCWTDDEGPHKNLFCKGYWWIEVVWQGILHQTNVGCTV